MNLSPDLSAITSLLGVDEATVRKVLQSWGPGKFDAALFVDGKALRPDGKSGAVLLPAAFGLAGVNLHTYEGWGSVTHWNAFVANLEMHGRGTFFDPRLDDAARFPIAAKAGLGHVRNVPDLITPKLADLQLYQLALEVKRAPGEISWKSPYGTVLAMTRQLGQHTLTEKEVHEIFTVPRLKLQAEKMGVHFDVSPLQDDGWITLRVSALKS